MVTIPLDLAATLTAVIDEGTMDAAARRLRVTPSAVSQRIRALENATGRVLLARTKPMSATPAGDAVIRFARQAALLERDAVNALDDGSSDGHGHGTAAAVVPLAVNADSLATWFLAPLARLTASRAVVFDLHRDDQDFTAGLLEAGTVMGAVTSRSTPVAGCRVRPLGAMRYEAVATASFVQRWLRDGAIPAALADAPLVDFDRRDELQSRWLEARGVDPARPPRSHVPASHDFATAVRLGLGWGMLPRLQSRDALRSGDLALLGGPPIDVPLYWQQWNLRSELLDAVAEAVVEAGRRALGHPD